MKRICVYCGSSPGEGNDYITAAEDLADELVKRGLGLVYGGASVGVMGAIANAVMQRGGEVIGIIPDALMRKEIGNDHLTELRVVGSMHERKAAMADCSDGFIALPGGMGPRASGPGWHASLEAPSPSAASSSWKAPSPASAPSARTPLPAAEAPTPDWLRSARFRVS